MIQAKKTPTLPSTTAPVLLEIPSPFLQTVAMSSQELPYTPGALTNPGGSTSKDSSLTGPSTLPTVPWPDEQSTAELVQLLLAAQHETHELIVDSLLIQSPFFCTSFSLVQLPQTLCSMINFKREVVSTFDLAEAVAFGLIITLKAKVHNFQLLLVSPFKYFCFEQHIVAFNENLPRWAPIRSKVSTSTSQNAAARLSAKDDLWRLCASNIFRPRKQEQK
ncbi:uncharacterized protein VP01_2018g2 [Puccinia sorghi]|uniref:Uncharacterized protein n=1 Tax=Puccinia sorghi TaxID=27349 RepID=A0A0L6VBB0_9BASI|nr:uncharacterized protein VP01_2018g2 [Puccinia sorghi]